MVTKIRRNAETTVKFVEAAGAESVPAAQSHGDATVASGGFQTERPTN